MDNLLIVLEDAGDGLGDIVSARAFLTDFGEYDAFNRVDAEYLGEPLPPAACIGGPPLARGGRGEVGPGGFPGWPAGGRGGDKPSARGGNEARDRRLRDLRGR